MKSVETKHGNMQVLLSYLYVSSWKKTNPTAMIRD
jgi:hypothetical protein